MERFQARHVVIVRHGESEGDVRRAAFKAGAVPIKRKNSVDEEQTAKGHEQSLAAGRWITRHILTCYGIDNFDLYLVSPLIRARQSAESIGLSKNWQVDVRLSERNRGDIQGYSSKEHQQKYPDSYQQMKSTPFHWVPPNGESILRLSQRFSELINETVTSNNVIMMTHRDVMWACHVPIDKMPLSRVESLDTDIIENGYIFHYTNIDPETGLPVSSELLWKRSVNPWSEQSQNNGSTWHRL